MVKRRWVQGVIWTVLIGWGLHPTHPLCAQTPAPGNPTEAATAGLQTSAIIRGDIGIGWINIPVGQIASDATVRILTKERDDRVLYPAVEIYSQEPEPQQPPVAARPGGRRIGGGVVIQRLRTAIDRLREHIDPVEHIRIHFLFTGHEPLHVVLDGDVEQSMVIEPIVLDSADAPRTRDADAQYRTAMANWWDGYVQQTRRQIQRSDYPTLIERYLMHMLGQRFGFEVPDLLNVKSKKPLRPKDPRPTLSLLAGVETLRDEVSERLWYEPLASPATQPSLPQAPKWKSLPIPEIPEDLEVEPIANAIPEDFFYIRFGSFANYLWFQRIGESRGGDIAQLAMLRGFNYEASSRVERMLNTRLTAVSKLFGDSVISDMAIVGFDLYMQEGPSMGVVFEAKNFAVLKASMDQERQATLRRMESAGCRMETVSLEGVDVSLLSTPDHQVRSFMVEANPYLFLTSSKTLAKRFLQVQKTKQSLANNRAFRFARWMMPVANKYDVFAYFSSEFFRNLISPQYQIELQRRMHAIAAIETAELAAMVDESERRRGFSTVRSASRVESSTDPTNRAIPESVSEEIDRWILNGYLPPWFQKRVDGSETLRFQGAWMDSVRGRRGSFLPIADTPVVDCSPEEAAEYAALAEFYANQWQETDPLMFGLRRFTHPDIPKAERLAIEAYVAPLGSDKYGMLGMLLAPPVPTQVIMPPDDVINAQVRLAGSRSERGYAEDYFLFAGLKDMVPPLPEETKGLIATLRLLRSLPAYLGTWPKPGYIDRLPLGLGGGPPDVMGFSRSLFGMWRWQMGGFSVLAFDRSILESCAMYLQLAPANDYAQGRLHVQDLSKSKLSVLFNNLGFRQAAQTTRGNLLLLDSLQQQLGVAPERSRERAEQLLDAKLQCTLGGDYQFVDGTWITTAWPTDIRLAPNTQPSTIGFDSLHTIAPDGYQASWLQWFRGANLHLTQLPERLVVIGELDMEPLPPPKTGTVEAENSGGALPNLNIDIYNLPFQFFQRDKPNAKSNGDAEPKKQNVAPEPRRKF